MSVRWRISGLFTTTAPMHIGSGAVLERDEDECDVASVVRDHQGRPCIPGTALKGVLRAWAERFFADESAAIVRIFGDRGLTAPTAEAGWAEFSTAMIRMPAQADRVRLARYVPYWRQHRCAGIVSNVCINRNTGAPQANKLFYQEFVPEGVSFDVEIAATRLTDGEVALLLAILEQGAAHPTHPYQFGANAADGWGRCAWLRLGVKQWRSSRGTNFAQGGVGYDCCDVPWESGAPTPQAGEAPPHVSAELALSFQGPFLVDDASRARTDAANDPENAARANFTPLRRSTGGIWLPSSSFRGALRQRTEFLLRSLDENATGDPNEHLGSGPIERIFGQTSRAARLTIEEFSEDGRCPTRRQDFVAIDRFTGGAADGAKFDAEYADRPTLKTRLVLDLDGLERQDVALLALSLRDVCRGNVTFGFGAGKGYGEARGELTSFTWSGAKADWNVPASAATGTIDAELVGWLNAALELLPRLAVAPAPAAASAPPSSRPVVVRTGTLGWQSSGNRRRRVVHIPNQPLPLQINRPDELAPALRQNNGDNIAVDFELENGQPVRIRPAGEPWVAGQAMAGAVRANRFIHPYYFLTLTDRSAFRDALADERPVGHERLQLGRYTGKIAVRLTTKTPLLICDDQTASVDAGGHKTYAMRTVDGKPLMASSSVRGMLRSAFEAITNSRLAVFPGNIEAEGEPADKHGRRLGFRLPANTPLGTVPVRIVRHNGTLAAELLPGSSTIPGNGQLTPGNPVFAAWCGSYGWAPPGRAAFGHRAEVWGYLTPWHYHRTLPSGGAVHFDFWNVEEVRDGSLPKPSMAPASRRRAFGRSQPATWGTPDWRIGYLCVTERNMNNKHDERFFFSSQAARIIAPLENEAIVQWRQLIQDYQDQHRRELENGVKRPPALHPTCRFSRHISHNLIDVAADEQVLDEGDLCHAEVTNAGGAWSVRALYPVMISRKLYDRSPLDLLPDLLRPATTINGLSPADRVFGWVSHDAVPDDPEPAYRGHVRVGPVTCTTEDAVETFREPKALAVLGQPKPQQGRFYLGRANGSAQNTGISKAEAGYGGANRVRGPKVYPHHHQFAEAIAMSGVRSNQNRSVTGWVRPGTVFEFDLHVADLTVTELGALVWLLSLPAEHFLRMGLGKPLGFGSARAEIIRERTRVADGAAWAAGLSAWDSPPPESCDLAVMKGAFEAVINRANPTLLRSFQRAAEGFAGLPVHYPRCQNQQVGSGEHYKWFVKNEQGPKGPLPDLSAADPSLPLL
ncbi:MAG: TIGR03986 family CRISPR-associated RAMP protein [Isosphaeraceae bacterium]|nr:TIGR03986 family CRISPR-associated RAMP protein [Isosphaeraceae bacterium]